jgi:hypothetical protein
MMGRGEKGKPEAGFRMYEVQFSSVQFSSKRKVL